MAYRDVITGLCLACSKILACVIPILCLIDTGKLQKAVLVCFITPCLSDHHRKPAKLPMQASLIVAQVQTCRTMQLVCSDSRNRAALLSYFSLVLR